MKSTQQHTRNRWHDGSVTHHLLLPEGMTLAQLPGFCEQHHVPQDAKLLTETVWLTANLSTQVVRLTWTEGKS